MAIRSDQQPIHSVGTGEKSNRTGNLSKITDFDSGAHDCVNSYTVIIFYAFDMFHILLSGDSFRDLWNVCMYVSMYVCMHACMYARIYVCMYVRMYVCMYEDSSQDSLMMTTRVCRNM
jgi:hypothetical protein